jgi:hypothetical protein
MAPFPVLTHEWILVVSPPCAQAPGAKIAKPHTTNAARNGRTHRLSSNFSSRSDQGQAAPDRVTLNDPPDESRGVCCYTSAPADASVRRFFV